MSVIITLYHGTHSRVVTALAKKIHSPVKVSTLMAVTGNFIYPTALLQIRAVDRTLKLMKIQ